MTDGVDPCCLAGNMICVFLTCMIVKQKKWHYELQYLCWFKILRSQASKDSMLVYYQLAQVGVEKNYIELKFYIAP
jgi:hypothetical protein